MRWITTRAWSKKEKCFIDDYIIDSRGNEYQFNKCEFWGDDRDVIVMLGTGLTDKTGKPIYEGDIVKIKYYGKSIITQVTIETGKTVMQCEPFNQYNYSEDGYDEPSTCEIIGNIYENPELLK